LAERDGAATAWVGDSLLVYGGLSAVAEDTGRPSLLGDAGLVDPGTGQFTPVDPPPFDHPLEPGTTVMAARILGVFMPPFREPGDAPYWSFDASSGQWTQLPGPGVRVDDECFAADRLVVVTGTLVNAGSVVATPSEGGSGVLNDPELRSLDLREPSDGWQATDAAEGQLYVDSPELACGGGFALLHDGSGQEALAVRFELGARWEVVSSTPERHVFTQSVWTGEDLLLLDRYDGVVAAYDPEEDRWQEQSVPVGEAVWTGQQLVVLSAEEETGVAVVEVQP